MGPEVCWQTTDLRYTIVYIRFYLSQSIVPDEEDSQSSDYETFFSPNGHNFSPGRR